MNANAFQYANTNRNHNRYAKCLKKLVEQNYVYQNIYESKPNGLITSNWVLGCYGDGGLIGVCGYWALSLVHLDTFLQDKDIQV